MSITKIAEYIEGCKEKVNKDGSSLKVICCNCQSEMKRIGAQLSEGATKYIGYYTCLNDATSVRIILVSKPDLPYELYDKNRRSDINK